MKLWCVFWGMIFFSSCLKASSDRLLSVADEIDKQNDLQHWTLQQGVLDLKLVQRYPKAIKGFFLARGFPSEIATQISRHCVFQTILKNSASSEEAPVLRVSLKAWRVRHQGKLTRIKLKEKWQKEWSKEEISTAARVAFRWSTFPTEQTFEPVSDYAWGMITIGLPPDEPFDLQVVWKQGDRTHKRWIENMRCPEDN